MITDEKLKEDETRKYLENAFRDGAVKTTGTDIDKLMPPVSRFGGGNRANKKQGIIEKIKASGIEFDQAINEKNCWVHISYNKGHNRKHNGFGQDARCSRTTHL